MMRFLVLALNRIFCGAERWLSVDALSCRISRQTSALESPAGLTCCSCCCWWLWPRIWRCARAGCCGPAQGSGRGARFCFRPGTDPCFVSQHRLLAAYDDCSGHRRGGGPHSSAHLPSLHQGHAPLALRRHPLGAGRIHQRRRGARHQRPGPGPGPGASRAVAAAGTATAVAAAFCCRRFGTAHCSGHRRNHRFYC